MTNKKNKQIININIKNIGGVLTLDNFNYFYKILYIEDYKKEIYGYEIIKKFFPVPNLVFKDINNSKGLLIYEYEKSVGFNKGLLVDLFIRDNMNNLKKQKKILILYKNVFLKTIKKTNKNSSKIFFEERINSRLKKFYNNKFIDKYDGLKIRFNNRQIVLNIKKIKENVEKYFSNNKKKWSVVSQCDPGDLNIGIKPVIFDYLGGGYNPIMAEFAVFFWYNIAQNNYFSPIYNKNTFVNHPRIFNKLDKVELSADRLNHKINNKRKLFLFNYIDNVLAPTLKETSGYDDWYEDLKNYLAMRILCVFNVAKMERKDLLLSLVYLEIFYNNQNIFKLSDLKKMVDEIY